MLKQYFSNQNKRFQQITAAVVVLVVAIVGTLLLLGGHAATPYAAITADSGTLANGATKQACSGASDGNCVKFGSTGGGGGGNGTLLFNGTFDSTFSKYAYVYSGKVPNTASRTGLLSWVTVLNSQEAQYNINTASDPGGNGHYRADISTSNIYPSGVPECTTIPIQFPNGLATVPGSSWLQFAEAKDPPANLAGWGMIVTPYYGGQNEFAIDFNGYNNDAPAWTSSPIDTGIHTLSICTNNANNSSGVVYGIWLDGVRQTFNHGTGSGLQTLSGFAIIDDGASTWPLDINDYTGGSPVPNTLIHGAPLVYTMGSNGLPPMPSGGWTSF